MIQTKRRERERKKEERERKKERRERKFVQRKDSCSTVTIDAWKGGDRKAWRFRGGKNELFIWQILTINPN